MAFVLKNRLGGSQELTVHDGMTVFDALLANLVPPASVLVTHSGAPVADSLLLEPDRDYEARLIEGYDLDSIRSTLKVESEVAPEEAPAAYLKRRLSFSVQGDLELGQEHFSVEDVAALVEETVADTITRFGLIVPHETVVMGLSGGVDSASLLIALSRASHRKAPPFRLVAATFEDYDSTRSLSVHNARLLADRFGVEHHVIPAGLAEKTFHLSRPLSAILVEMMETADAHQTMYVDHHTTRRCLEVLASTYGASCLALGLHASDLVAGLLNAQMTGWPAGPVPCRPVGDFRYVFPLAFVPKKELSLHYLARTGDLPPQSAVNAWELHPKDRNFYYWLADFLQTGWPGLEAWMYTGHRHLMEGRQPVFCACRNCGAAVRADISGEVEICDVCELLCRMGYVGGAPAEGAGRAPAQGVE